MAERVKQELIGEIVKILETHHGEPGEAWHASYWKETRTFIANKILAKAEPLIRQDERERIFSKIEAQSNNLLRSTGLFHVALTEEEWQALKGEGK